MNSTSKSSLPPTPTTTRPTLPPAILEQRSQVLNRILDISSLPTEVKKILHGMFKTTPRTLKQLDLQKLGDYLDNLYDEEYVNKFQTELGDYKGPMPFEKGIEILQVFIVSESERDYIQKIRKKVFENENLDEKLEKVKKEIAGQFGDGKGVRVQRDYYEGKLEAEVQVFENKLEKANQKLNLSITENRRLRKKIDLMRKEKNIIQKIYE